jgi:nitroimidazol reductase NimA-like FMN-containing flavoprotein (pyridoxamine 5'-phosphate oxidase superfamily)
MDQRRVTVRRMQTSDRITVRRIPKRAHYDQETIHAILDEALICHVGFVMHGEPFVIPTIHARVGGTLYLHGAIASRMLKVLGEGGIVCASATLVDGLVLARSAFHHSMNYRSVSVFGHARRVTDPREIQLALDAIVDHVAPGRRAEVRSPNEKELAATAVVALPIEEASAKVRTGGPIDDEEDHALDVWAGVLPLAIASGTLVDDARLRPGLSPSEAVRSLARGVMQKE